LDYSFGSVIPISHCIVQRFARFDLFPEGDHGGNSNYYRAAQKNCMLCGTDFPAALALKFNAVQKKAISLTHEYELEVAGRKAAADLNIETW